MSDKRKEAAIKALRENYIISGDGVARRDMSKAMKSAAFRRSAKELINANLIQKAEIV